jgi:hypothetical protein
MERIKGTERKLSEIYVNPIIRHQLIKDPKADFNRIYNEAGVMETIWLIVGYDRSIPKRQQNVFFVGRPKALRNVNIVQVSEIEDSRLTRRKPVWNLEIRFEFFHDIGKTIIGKFRESDTIFEVDMIHAIPSNIVDFIFTYGLTAIEEDEVNDLIPDTGDYELIVPRIWDPMTTQGWLPGWEIRKVQEKRIGKIILDKTTKKKIWDSTYPVISYLFEPGRLVMEYRELFKDVDNKLGLIISSDIDSQTKRELISRRKSVRRVFQDRKPLILEHIQTSNIKLKNILVGAYYSFRSQVVVGLKEEEKKIKPRRLFESIEEESVEPFEISFYSDIEELESISEETEFSPEGEYTPRVPVRSPISPGEIPESIKSPEPTIPRLELIPAYKQRSWTIFESPATIPTINRPRFESPATIPTIISPRFESPVTWPQSEELPRF